LGVGEIAHIEMEHYARAGIAPLRILRMATAAGAEHLGANDLGAVAPANLADLILVDGNPDVDIRALRNISMVVKNGQILTA
jgi:imidazolonepropionase-like amidohydrolase